MTPISDPLNHNDNNYDADTENRNHQNHHHYHHHYSPHFPFWCGNYVLWGIPTAATTSTTTTTTTSTFIQTQTTNGDERTTTTQQQHQQQYDVDNDDMMICNNNNNIITTYIRNKTIHGLAIDVYGRATIGMSSIFLGPALLHLANIAAGCSSTSSTSTNLNEEQVDNNTTTNTICTNTIYGFRPSSLLTNIAAISGIVGCMALPFIGSIMDHTHYRKYIGSISGILLCIIKIIEFICLSNYIQTILSNVWLYIAILQIVASVTFYTHLTAAYAYLSELSSIPSQQSHYNTSFFIIMYGSTLFFMVEVLILSSIFQNANANNNNTDDDDDDGDVGTAQTALFITIITCTACFYYSWTYCFPYATAKKAIPLHQSVYSAGFYTLYHTMKQLLSVDHPTTKTNSHHRPMSTTPTLTTRSSQPRHHIVNTFDHDENDVITSIPPLNHDNDDDDIDDPHPGHIRPTKNHAMFYILCSVSFSEAAANAIIVISTTYMKEMLQFNANQSYV